VACRQKFDKRHLTRIVRTADEGVIVDPTGKRNGRGAYLCDQVRCWDKILTDIKLLNKALMTEVTPVEQAGLTAHKPANVEMMEKVNDGNKNAD
jgi:predicted RNA-binding protein YlxR (DUF448 family)